MWQEVQGMDRDTLRTCMLCMDSKQAAALAARTALNAVAFMRPLAIAAMRAARKLRLQLASDRVGRSVMNASRVARVLKAPSPDPSPRPQSAGAEYVGPGGGFRAYSSERPSLSSQVIDSQVITGSRVALRCITAAAHLEHALQHAAANASEEEKGPPAGSPRPDGSPSSPSSSHVSAQVTPASDSPYMRAAVLVYALAALSNGAREGAGRRALCATPRLPSWKRSLKPLGGPRREAPG